MATKPLSRFAYFDTNIISELAKHREMWPAVRTHLFEHNLVIAVSAQLAELSDASRLFDEVNALLLAMPSALIKPANMVLDEEVAAHPFRRSGPLTLFPLNALVFQDDGARRIKDYLESEQLREVRADQRAKAEEMFVRHAERKGNFPPAPNGRYQRNQAEFFAWTLAIQWLAGTHRPFLEQFRGRLPDFHAEAIARFGSIHW